MAGPIGSIQRGTDGSSYGFVLYDKADKPAAAGNGNALRAAMTDLPTARNTLPKDAWLCLFV